MGDEAPVPHRVGAHEILLPIATDGPTSVLLARPSIVDAEGNREVPDYVTVELTRPPASSEHAWVAAFLASVAPLRRLRNANVVRMFDAGNGEHGAFVVMDYVPGDSLAGLDRLARESGTTVPKAIALRILVDALKGLHAAHELMDDSGAPLALVHGDFSPRNVLVGTDGITRVTGFGHAKAQATIGKPLVTAYAPPEGPSDDRRTDIWAAGVIAWEIFTGQKYDALLNTAATASVEPPRVSSIATVPAALDEIIAQALRVERDARTTSALELADALSAAGVTAGLLADRSAVAAHVMRAAGPELVEREALFAAVRRAARERAPSAPDVRTLIGIAGALPAKRGPLPSLPDLPPPVDDGRSDLRIAIEPPGRPAERADEGILGQPSGAPVEEEPQAFRSPLGPALAPAPTGTDDAAAAGLPSKRAPLRRLVASLEPWVTPPWTTRKISVFAGIGGALIGFMLVLVALSGRTKDGALTAGSSDALTASATSSNMGDAPSPVAAKNALGGSPATAASAVEGSQLHITANAPIAHVRVDGRVVDAIVPAPTIRVDLEESERDHPLRIVATSTDGRSATATTDPAAALSEIEVTFGPKPARRPRPRPAPATTVKHPWTKSKR